MKRSWQKLGLVPSPKRAQSVSVPSHLSFQCRRDFSTTFPALPSETQDESTRFYWKHNQRPIGRVKADGVLEKEAKQNLRTLDHSPRKIYGEYLAAVDSAEGDSLPLEIHQAVLRACTSPRGNMRECVARLVQVEELSWNQLSHPYESRFYKIMQNIIGAGFKPSIEDYHFIMSQFAAVGHHVGVQTYIHQMERMGLEPNAGTFAFFLQAIAHRLSLPTPDSKRPVIVRKLVDIAMRTIREMGDRQIPPSKTNFDLAFRILGEVQDPQGLAELLRLGYGIDLNYLDSPPPDAASIPSTSSTSVFEPPSGMLPFPTHALNSLIQALGRWGQISKMVYVFETLTNPLPAPIEPDNAFDDDDDDFSPIQQEWKPPSAQPNTTSFSILVRYCATRGYPVLAKHYATQLMHEEHMATLRLRNELREKSLSEVAVPRLAVGVRTLEPIHGLANRTHDVELLRWVIWACKLSIRRKYRTWIYFDQTKARYEHPTSDVPATPESLPSSSPSPTSPSLPNLSRPLTFDVNTHLWVLKNDIAALSVLKWKAESRLFDTVNRSKARLGRRVWDRKDVFMRDMEARVMVNPEVWKEKVNFKENKRKVESRPKVKKKYLGKHFDPVIANIGSSKS